MDDQDVLYSTRPDGAAVLRDADVTGLVLHGDSPRHERPERRDRRRRQEWERGNRRSREGPSPGLWRLAIRHRTGSVETAVDEARTKSTILTFALLGVLALSAILLVRSTAHSRRLAEMQFRFAAGVSHDLRTPLTAIRGAAHNVRQGFVKDAAGIERYMGVILKSSEELTAMVENVLAYSVTLRRQGVRLQEPVNILEILQKAAAAMHNELEASGCRLEIDAPPGLPPINGDRMALEHAFRNLISNAARHGSAGKWVGVFAAGGGSGITVRVCDRGPGIPRKEQSRIFEPFFRGESARLQGAHGAGLGLSLVQQTVVAHGGKISVESEDGKGAQFTVWLPLREA